VIAYDDLSARGGVADGIAVVDKPAGQTSHDVVAQVRRLAGTRRVGHAGTLDPMATGVLVVGIGRGTRLLGHLAAGDKEYVGTVRLGVTTSTDDAEGEVLTRASASWDRARLPAALAGLTGAIEQVPPAYSAIKVGGQRSYARARAGEDVVLAPRRVTVSVLEPLAVRADEVDLHVVCSSGTYVRALARDLGAALGVGGHLAALRRTRVGRFERPRPLAEGLAVLPLADAVAAAFPRRDVDDDAAQALRHGRPLPPTGATEPVGVFGPGGEVLALVADRAGMARPLCVLLG
jgi:tRNA pseudouridine55 synthase